MLLSLAKSPEDFFAKLIFSDSDSRRGKMLRLSGFFYNSVGKLQNWLPWGYNNAIIYPLYSAHKRNTGLFVQIHMAKNVPYHHIS